MKRTANMMTTLLVVLGGLVVAAISWFLFISPSRATAADANAQRAAAVEANAALETQIAALKVDYANLPELREKLWKLRDQFPATQDVSAARDLLQAIASHNGLEIGADTFGVPQAVQPGLKLSDAYTAIGQKSYVDTLKFENLVETSVTVTTTGPLAGVLGFLDDVQMGDHRYFLVSGFELRPVLADPTASPPVPAGSAELLITAKIYTLDYGKADAILRPAADPMPGDFLLPSEEVPPPPSGKRDIFLPVN